MKGEASRTSKSLKNARYAILFYFLYLFLQFFSRKVFLDKLGAELLGLNTTIANILSFLNLAELGVAAAVSFSLYKPLLDRNENEINNIMSIQGWLYRKVARVVLVVALFLLLAIPFIFRNTSISLGIIYATFLISLAGVIFSYLVNYTQILLVADQREYKVNSITQGARILKIILQIIAVYYFQNGYILWLTLELIFSVLTAYFLHRIVFKTYPWLKIQVAEGSSLREKYPHIIAKTKQLIFHQLSQFILNQTTPIIIFSILSLTTVAIYGNYMLIVNGILLFINAMFSGAQAGIGNLVAENNKGKILAFFGEFAVLKYWIVSVICFVMIFQTQGFIALWVGEKYVLPMIDLYLLVAYLFILVVRVTDGFIYAYGLFQDVWAQILEMFLNLGLSTFLGFKFGLTGILAGILISQFLLMMCWKPYFLFKFGIRESFAIYLKKIFIYVFCIVLSFCFSRLLYFFLPYFDNVNYFQWVKNALLLSIAYLLVSIFVFASISSDFRKVIVRVKNIVLSIMQKNT
ncbi:hypothetical protein [Sphingobacterium multivorum]|uniref:lipopolysaccharide biosynthesis protein n=1 Tax=Sphingobacterium multivorum TaxID=28454 RepID=UPI002FDE7030